MKRIEAKLARILYWQDFFARVRVNGATWGDAIRRTQGRSELPKEFALEPGPIREEVIYRVTYAGYLEREERHIQKLQHAEKIRIPNHFNFLDIRGLRKESALKLSEIKPTTVGQASRISGVNPSDISILMVAVESHRRNKDASI